MPPKLKLTNLPTDVAHEIAVRMNRGDLARLRTASKATKNFGKAGYSCTSQRIAAGLRIDTTTVSETGQLITFETTIEPLFVYVPEQEQTLARMRVSITGYDGPVLWGGSGSLVPGALHITWWTGVRPSRYIRDQLYACLRTQMHRHAAYIAAKFTTAFNAALVQDGAATVAEVDAAADGLVTTNPNPGAPRAGSSCTSQRRVGYLGIKTTVVSLSGERITFNTTIQPRWWYSLRYHQQRILSETHIGVTTNADHGEIWSGRGSIRRQERLAIDWWTGRMSRHILDQLYACLRAEIRRHAAHIAQMSVDAFDAVMVQQGATTAAAVQAAAANITD